jgi:hypothetical protein
MARLGSFIPAGLPSVGPFLGIHGIGLALAISVGLSVACGGDDGFLLLSPRGPGGDASFLGGDPADRIASIEVVPDTAQLTGLGTRFGLTAFAVDSGGGIITGLVVTWTSEDSLVATVSETGVVTAVGGGVTSVTASTTLHSGSAEIIVVAAAPLSLLRAGGDD